MRVPERPSWPARAAGWALAHPRRMWESPAPLDAYALVHAASTAGDALTAIALADSVFFSIPVGQATYRVALYLALTMAPLAFAAPLLIPLLDRRGFRRAITFAASFGRAIAAVYAAPRYSSLVLFPAAFVILILSKVHGVTRNALVAAYAGTGERLVSANARLARVGAVGALLAALPGVIVVKVGGAAACLYAAAAVYALCAGLGLRLPQPPADLLPPTPVDTALRRGRMTSLATAALGAGALRGAQGFLVLLMAFSVRRAGEPLYWLGLLALVAVAGAYVGDLAGPRLAHGVREESVVLASLIAAGVAALFTADIFSLLTLITFTALASAATELGRLSFLSLMQREAPGGVRGRVFVRYEVVFQLAWVVGAFLPAFLPITFRQGVFMLAAFYLIVGIIYVVRSRGQREEDRDSRSA